MLTKFDPDDVKKIIAEQLGMSLEELADDSSFDSLGADSLDKVEIIINLERRYDGLNIPDEDATNITTVGRAIEYIRSKHKQ